jgi:hypothetical protein|tara:strand:+ start:30 stop:638 length:609 start_codon:yes stop_codon:yes gene_type:complete
VWTNTQIAKYIVPQVATHGDDRLGLGYGQLQQKFHEPMVSAQTFPFPADEDLGDDEDDYPGENSQGAVKSKVDYFQPNDFLAYKKANRLYYAGASTKLAACFFRPDEILLEIGATGKSIVPIPGLYKNRTGPAVGGYSTAPVSFDERPYKRTGTTRGWAATPPESAVEAEIEYEEDEPTEEFFDLKSLAKLQRRSLGEHLFF